MMGLADTLRLRAARQGRTAEVLCGALGSVTVEALPPRELELLRRGADSARAIFYAACRELQAAGEALHRTGEIYTPDGILQFVSQKEAEAAARAENDSAGKTLRTDTLLTAAVQEVGTQQRQDLPDADAAARRLLEGLRMASRARGG